MDGQDRLDGRREAVVAVRLTPEERAWLQDCAARTGLSLSGLLRAGLRALRREPFFVGRDINQSHDNNECCA